MRKTLIYTSFAISSLLVVLTFVTAKSYIQLGVAVLLYPLLVYYAYELFIKKKPLQASLTRGNVLQTSVLGRPGSPSGTPTAAASSHILTGKKQEKETTPEKEVIGVVDIDRRAFLKLIGATGISFFIYSLFGRRAEALLFDQSLQPGLGTNSTPQTRSLDGYRIAEIDDSMVSYYGFINGNGEWFVMKEDTDGSFRYSKGESDFPYNWENREDLRYDYFHNLF